MDSNLLDEAAKVIEDLYKNPFPYDLLRVRNQVDEDYDNNEAAAKEEMACYCSQDFLTKALTSHYEAQMNAAEWLKNFKSK